MKIYYFHGFGMDATNNGMFSEIGNFLGSHYHSVLTPFNKEIEGNQTLVAPLTRQIEDVEEEIKTSGERCIVIAHSQGCIATAYALNQPGLNVTQAIFISPPSGGAADRFITYLKTLQGANIIPTSKSYAPLPNGRQAVIPPECFIDMDKYYDNVKVVYENIDYPLHIIRAGKDDTLGPDNDYADTKLNITTIPSADHSFTIGNSRQELLDNIRSIILPIT
jgi:pimeloyl-ACP methyl ester carboxylesterase